MDDFEDGDVADWGIGSDPTTGTIQAVTMPVSPSGGNYVSKMTFGSSCWGKSRTFAPVAADYVSFYFRSDGDTGHPSGVGVILSGSDGLIGQVSYHQGALRYRSDDVVYQPIVSASTGIWYLIEFRNIDWDSDTFDIWVDGVEYLVGATMYVSNHDVSGITNYACPWVSGSSYLDDITFGFEDDRPILDFDLTQGSGTTVIDSANGIVGTTHETLWSTDPSGTPVLYFDNPIIYWFADGDYFEIPYHTALNAPSISMEAVVYPMSSGYYTVFAEQIRDGGTFQGIMVLALHATGYETGRSPYFALDIGGSQKTVLSPYEIPLNEWSHIVGTYDGNDMKLYIDGMLVATEFNVGGPRTTGSNPLYLGHPPTSNHYFNGYYSAFKLYDYALTAEEIAAMFNAPPVADANGPYSVNEGSVFTLDGAGSTDADENIALYEWDLDNDGLYNDAVGMVVDTSFADDGIYTVGLKVTDDYGAFDMETAEVLVLNVAPTIEQVEIPVAPIQTGAIADVSALIADVGVLDTHTALWDWGDGSTSVGVVSGYTITGSHEYDAPGLYTLLFYVEDDDGGFAEQLAQYLVVYDPKAGFVTGGGWFASPTGADYSSDLPYFDGSYYDMIPSELPLNWFEARDTAAGLTYGSCTSAHLATISSQEEYNKILELFGEYPGGWLGGFQDEGVFPADTGWQWVTGEPFVFSAWLDGEPNDSPFGVYADAAEQQLEMYPTGWNDVPGDSPRNSFVVEYQGCDSNRIGKVTFGFVSKYKKGAELPEGNTEFQFQAGGLNFHSTSYDWLVVTGNQAIFQGTGTLEGEGEYGFFIAVIDEMKKGNNGADKFRIKIWDKVTGEVIYDNQSGDAMNAAPIMPLEGGTIVIHKAN